MHDLLAPFVVICDHRTVEFMRKAYHVISVPRNFLLTPTFACRLFVGAAAVDRPRALCISYAIKKVVFRGMGVSHPRAQAVMREVQCLAQLDHRNIVRYHTSWLESGWMENGVGRGPVAPGPAPEFADAGDDNRTDRNMTSPISPTVRALAATDLVAEGNDAGRDKSLHARLDALVPSHMQPQLIKGLEQMVRSRDSASESGSGWGWGAESDSGYGGSGSGAGGGGGVKGPWRMRPHGSLTRGSRILRRAGCAGDRRGSVSPQVNSPRSLLRPLPGRERGFSHWSAEDYDSETSRWSEEASSNAGGRDVCNDYLESSDIMTAAEPSNTAAAFRTTVGIPTTASPLQPAKNSRYAAAPSAMLRARRSEQFRHPSIDLDDLVSFGTVTENDDDTYDEMRDGWHGCGASGASDNLGVDRRRGTGRRRRGSGNGGRGRGRDRAATALDARRRSSVSPDGVIHYPVTLYIQMTLCPGDTLQDWLRKRNTRLSSEAETEDGAGVGVFVEETDSGAPIRGFELEHRDSRRSSGTSGGSASEPVSTTKFEPVPVLEDPALLHRHGGNDDDGDAAGTLKPPRETPVSSPRTDPATSESSGGLDETLEFCSDSAAAAAPVGGMSCPPPTRETSSNLRCAFSNVAGGDVSVKNVGEVNGRPSPVGSVSSVTSACEWKGEHGSSRVDLHEALGLFRQLVDGVAHVHSKGIIHRDIKVSIT